MYQVNLTSSRRFGATTCAATLRGCRGVTREPFPRWGFLRFRVRGRFRVNPRFDGWCVLLQG